METSGDRPLGYCGGPGCETAILQSNFNKESGIYTCPACGHRAVPSSEPRPNHRSAPPALRPTGQTRTF